MRAFARARVKPNKRYACCLGLGRTQGLYTGQGELAVAVAMSLCVAVPNAPYVPKVMALKPMLRPFSSMILFARRSLEVAYAFAPAARTLLDRDEIEESMVG